MTLGSKREDKQVNRATKSVEHDTEVGSELDRLELKCSNISYNAR